MLFKLEKPNLSKINKKELSRTLAAFTFENKREIFDFLKKIVDPEYLYWDKIYYKEPSPKGISKENLWMIIKFFRESKRLKTRL